ncbi:Asp-tRNA(Asn)/Glu-tRNA(Gln) amidotransferase GatCAB subunit C [Candidatus Dependentiae bacterium]|nr:Asp-tRNA(Asn)/Glu-tRNA(Gln) amidotransferase GatCAB subunit C [Candidatus Dependentiae bacterium]
MTDITKEELIKLARISQLHLEESEIIPLMTHVQSILAYAQRVKDIASSGEFDHAQQVNVLRPDVVIRTDNELILSRAPEREGNFFVVPKIIESK